MLRLMKTQTLTITRYETRGQQFDNTKGVYTDNVVNTTFDIEASIQPIRQGKVQNILPQGVTASDTVVVYTDKDNIIQTADQFTKLPADTTVYKGLTFEAFNTEDWGGNGLRTDHYRVIFIRQDLMIGL